MLNFRSITIGALIIIIFAAMLVLLVDVSPAWMLLVAFVWLLLISIGSMKMSWNFYLEAFTGKKTKRKIVALTFDDGPHPVFTPSVLQLLKKYHAEATFFCIGNHVARYPDVLRQLIEEGHTVGNHSYTHKNWIGFNSKNAWLEEINKTDDVLQSTIRNPQSKVNLFRPPYGVTNPHLAQAIKETGHNVIGWNVRPFDTKMPADVAIKRIKKEIKPGAIILLHDTHSRIENILEHTLIYLQQHGYKIVPLNKLMDEE